MTLAKPRSLRGRSHLVANINIFVYSIATDGKLAQANPVCYADGKPAQADLIWFADGKPAYADPIGVLDALAQRKP